MPMQEEKIGILGSFRAIRGNYFPQRVMGVVLAGVFGLAVLFLSLMASTSPVQWSRTVDPGEKARLCWEYADKRMEAAKALFEAGKENQALEATMKAEKYLEQTVEIDVKLHNELPRLAATIGKHRELMTLMSKNSDGGTKQLWEKQLVKNDLMAKKIANTLAEAK
jgi:hypothetical protein